MTKEPKTLDSPENALGSTKRRVLLTDLVHNRAIAIHFGSLRKEYIKGSRTLAPLELRHNFCIQPIVMLVSHVGSLVGPLQPLRTEKRERGSLFLRIGGVL